MVCRSMTLDRLTAGRTAIVSALTAPAPLDAGLREAGLVPGVEVEVLARGLFGGTPISVRVGRAVVALRRAEARGVEVAS